MGSHSLGGRNPREGVAPPGPGKESVIKEGDVGVVHEGRDPRGDLRVVGGERTYRTPRGGGVAQLVVDASAPLGERPGVIVSRDVTGVDQLLRQDVLPGSWYVSGRMLA
jgi:hypothetical protein